MNWININDKLPELSAHRNLTNYLVVWNNEGFQNNIVMDRDNIFMTRANFIRVYNVTHWMYLEDFEKAIKPLSTQD